MASGSAQVCAARRRELALLVPMIVLAAAFAQSLLRGPDFCSGEETSWVEIAGFLSGLRFFAAAPHLADD